MLTDTMQEQLANKAIFLHKNRHLFSYLDSMDVEDIFCLLCQIEEEKYERDALTDTLIDYNDEIAYIEELEDAECMDISVAGDNLFYANGVLTKNSFGLPATADFMLALIATDELKALNQILVKQLKNRYSDLEGPLKRFVIGVDRPRMRLFDTEPSAQEDLVNDTPVFDNSKTWKHTSDENKSKFSKGKFEDFK